MRACPPDPPPAEEPLEPRPGPRGSQQAAAMSERSFAALVLFKALVAGVLAIALLFLMGAAKRGGAP